MRIYLDSAPVIYSVEDVEPFAAKVNARLFGHGHVLIASEMTRLECRIAPIRSGNSELLGVFDRFFASLSQIIELPKPVFDLATQIRADYGFKTPDSLHLAAAMHANCEIFYSNDHRLDRFSGLNIEVV